MNKQPFYHVLPVLFTGTEDLSERANSPEFRKALEGFLKRQLGPVVKGSVELDGLCNAEPGDPSDLM